VSNVGERYTPEQVEAALYAAGLTLMALRVSGCWPAGYRSNMPEYLREPGDKAEAEFTPAQPIPSAVSAMDRALAWIKLLPGGTEYQIRVRRLVLARCLVSPRTEAPVFGWRKLGIQFGCSHMHAKTLWIDAVATITAALNRPGLCVAAGGRIGPAKRYVASAIDQAIRERMLEAA
jgi:hypothetical protein